MILTGVREDVNKLYSVFDVFCFPSLYEGLGIVLIEAQVNGLFCLTSDTVPKSTKVSDGIKYLPLDNIDIWLKEINKINKERRIIKYNKELAKYDITKLIKTMEKIYKIKG